MFTPSGSCGFVAEDCGATLVLVGVALALFLGMVALAFDTGRLSVTNSDLQSYADTVALAAAAELDGADDAIERAEAAAAALISDRQTFGTGDRILSGEVDYTLTFLSDLPADDTAPTDAVTFEPEEAVFVRVDAAPVAVDQGFARTFRVLMGFEHTIAQTTASAVAGFTQMACDVTPITFCVPDSDWSAEDPGNIGTMINLRSGGQGAAWGPGDFGFLEPNAALVDPSGPCAGLNGANLYRCLVGAAEGITGCVSQRGVDMEPGQREGLATPAFNTRFDIYTGAMQSERNDANYAPAPNVIKALVRDANNFNQGQQCLRNTADTSPETVSLPRDNCIEAGTCRIGNGTYSWTDYVDTNHAGVNPANAFGPYPNVLQGSRFEMYLAEIESVYGDPFSATWTGVPVGPIIDDPDGDGTNWESGLPVCSSSAPARPERRLIVAAGIDCDENPINGAAENVPVHEFVLMFLTEPAGNYGATTPPTLDIFAEVVGKVDGESAGNEGMGGVFRDLVQLYR